MKKFLILICIAALATSCGVSSQTAGNGGKITVGICKNGSRKETIKYFKKCVRNAGAKPYFFPYYATTDEMAQAYMASVDAVIIPGKAGGDTTGRGKYDLKVIRAAMDQGKPILGICLGHQEINSAYKGKIGKNVDMFPESEIRHMAKEDGYNVGLNSEAHPINIDTTSRLYKILGEERIMVNTSHNFSIKKLGDGLKVVAVADDGVVEGIEDNERNIMGVQFHPEFLYGKLHLKKFLPIFKNLVNEAREVKAAKSVSK